jgi:hypothetical protein
VIDIWQGSGEKNMAAKGKASVYAGTTARQRISLTVNRRKHELETAVLALQNAFPLSKNAYKIQITKVLLRRAIPGA